MGGIVSPSYSTPHNWTLCNSMGEGRSDVPEKPTHLYAGDLVYAAGPAPTCTLPPGGVRRLEIF